MKEARDKILLLEAWSTEWDAHFKLHVAQNTIVSDKVKDGKLTNRTIEPADRNKDVVVYKPQPASKDL